MEPSVHVEGTVNMAPGEGGGCRRGPRPRAIWNVRSQSGAARIHRNAPGSATPAVLQTPPVSTWPNFPSWAPRWRAWEDRFSVPLLMTLLRLESLKRLLVFSEQEAILFVLC